jgi:hypothetical protein
MYNPDIQNKIEMLPENAQKEIFDFVELLWNKYHKPFKRQLSDSENKEPSKFRKFRGVATVKMSTDEIMALTRGDE